MDRFWSKVQVSTPDDCWEWTASRLPFGYGRFKFRGRLAVAHRVSWVLSEGEIPDGLCVLHKCDNPSCVNPAHLFLGTYLDNNRDRKQKGRCGFKGGVFAGKVAKLTDEKVHVVRLYEKVVGRKHLANALGVCKGTIDHICQRRTWRHI